MGVTPKFESALDAAKRHLRETREKEEEHGERITPPAETPDGDRQH